VLFDPVNKDVWATVGDAMLVRWPAIHGGDTSDQPSSLFGRPEDILRGPFRLAGFAAEQRIVALADIAAGRLHLFAPGAARAGSGRSLSHPAVRQAAYTSGDRWMLVGGWKSPQVSLWSVPELRHVRDFADSDNATFAVGSGGRAALIGTPRKYRIMNTRDWTERHVLPRESDHLVTSYVTMAAAAPLAACQWTHDSVRLLDIDTGAWVATIPVTVTTGLDQMRLTADASALAIGGERHVVQWWDLRELDRELAELGLGWTANRLNKRADP
jgi:hypothetical protein